MTACDEKILQPSSSKLNSIALYKDLGDCNSKNKGHLVYVDSSDAVYLCTDSIWKEMNFSETKGLNGKDGVNGKDGKDGKNGADGKDGVDGKDGKDGVNGTNGENGTSCEGKANDDGSVTISCGGKVVGTIKNGIDGKNGTNGTNGVDGSSCNIESDVDGVVTLKCGEGESAVRTKLYKAVCGTTSYDPAMKFCFGVILYDLCDGKAYDPAEYECVENVVQKIAPKCGGVKYDSETQFCATRDNVVERVYKKVIIGDGDNAQTWMAENLNYETENSWCYDDEADNCTKYGRLYTWAAAINNSTVDDYGNIRGVCPDGWHLPTKAEFKKLITNVDADLNGTYNYTNKAGAALKSTSGWNNDGNGADAYGFSALPAGYRLSSGNFNNEGNRADFWSSTEGDRDEIASLMSLYYGRRHAVLNYSYYKNYGASVRCLQD